MRLFKKASGRRMTFDHLEPRQLLTIAMTAVTVSATQQSLFSGVVATFVDTNLSDTPSDFNTPPGSVQINWGDGSTTGGVVDGTAYAGLFDVEGSHTYAAAGTFPTLISVSSLGGQGATASGTSLVAAPVVTPPSTTTPQPFTIAGNNVSGTAGQALSGVTVATFLDTNTADTQGDFGALITWGDGQSSLGTVVGANGAFTVTGGHNYMSPGTYTVNTQIVRTTDGQASSTSSTALIASASPTAAFSGVLANIAGNGPHAKNGFTNTNRPTFTGTATPFSLVQVYARRFNVDALLPVGEAVTNASGQWSLTTGPLAVGTWTFTATVTPSGGSPSGMMTLTNQDGTDLVYIDLKPKFVKVVSHPKRPMPHPNVHANHPRPPKPPAMAQYKA